MLIGSRDLSNGDLEWPLKVISVAGLPCRASTLKFQDMWHVKLILVNMVS